MGKMYQKAAEHGDKAAKEHLEELKQGGADE